MNLIKICDSRENQTIKSRAIVTRMIVTTAIGLPNEKTYIDKVKLGCRCIALALTNLLCFSPFRGIPTYTVFLA